MLGSPTEERARRVDARRVTDLQAIAAATNLFWTRHARLPETLDDLAWRGVPRASFDALCDALGTTTLRERPRRWA